MFQKLMDVVLQGIPGVICYIDDIGSKDEEKHLKILEEVFTRLEQHGFILKLEKCEFLMGSVEYLGHQIDKDGIRALPNKVTAIANAPAPNNVQEFRSFLLWEVHPQSSHSTPPPECPLHGCFIAMRMRTFSRAKRPRVKFSLRVATWNVPS